jgi:hypothetical protein
MGRKRISPTFNGSAGISTSILSHGEEDTHLVYGEAHEHVQKK